MPRYSGATTDAEGAWWFAGQITGCESETSAGSAAVTNVGSSVASAATSPARGAGVSTSASCKPVTVYTVARVKAVALD